MTRFLFFVLLLANLAFAGHLYLNAQKPKDALPLETNRDAMKILSITDSNKARQEIGDAKKLVESMIGAKCAIFSVKPTDAAGAQTAFAAMALGERLSARNIEEFSRFAVSLPIQRDRKAADALVAALKKAGVKDMLVMADFSISLGLYSSEDAAKRLVSDLESKAASQVKGITVTAKNSTLKEVQFAIREPDAGLVTRLATIQRDIESANIKGGDCPASTAAEAEGGASSAKNDVKK